MKQSLMSKLEHRELPRRPTHATLALVLVLTKFKMLVEALVAEGLLP
jgi:hypothetical protein